MPNKVHGNLSGIRQTLLDNLQNLYETEILNKEFLNDELVSALCAFTHATGREAMVYINRAGNVEAVAVGEQDRVTLPPVKTRRSAERMCGLRCIHTHPGGDGRLSAVDIQTLKKLRLDAQCAIGVGPEGEPTRCYIGILNERTDSGLTHNVLGPFSVHKLPHRGLFAEIRAADTRIKPPETVETKRERPRAVLAGIDKATPDYDPLEELKELCETAGYDAVFSLRQLREKPDRTTYLGRGKVHDLQLLVQAWDADAVIFDDELSPGQIRNLQQELGDKLRILDRTALILEIFGDRASTHEGRLQVELAQIKYMMPRLIGSGLAYSRMGGGGGGGRGARRGGGEMELELDRRMLRERMHILEKQIAEVRRQRDTRRQNKEKTPVVALVGYTNAGKSTLLNTLTGSEVLAEDKLFATLDTTARRFESPGGAYVLVDTVGFINKLPHDLVQAFRATLEEATYADLLVHLVDATNPARNRHMEVVAHVLQELGAGDKPVITVYNKADLAGDLFEGQDCSISAVTGAGLKGLDRAITKALSEQRRTVNVVLPLNAGALLSKAYSEGQVETCEYGEQGITLVAVVPGALAGQLEARGIMV
ncbi:MAG: GTPase HflX [Clostridia bacterium]|nr:GTPase HflX [Clostridia bacterium]